MTQRTVAVNFTANVAGYNAAVGKATAATTGLGASAGKTNAAMAGRTGLAASVRQATAAFLPFPPTLLGAGGVVLGLKKAFDASVEFESALAGVRKTVDATEAEFRQIADGISAMALAVPAGTTEISAVAEAAGQLGISKDNILGFTRTMIDLGYSTNLSAQDAAVALARLANITQMPQEEFSNLGSTVVELGNNFATTESEIIDMALGIAGAGNIVGLTEPQMLAFAAVLSSVGIEAEAGGTAISRVFLEMMTAVKSGGDSLQAFAAAAGMSTTEFATAFETDAAVAVSAFISGLQDVQAEGGNVVAILESVGMSDVRVRRALLNMAGAGDLLTEALGTANEAWDENLALTEEAARRYATTESASRMLGNALADAGARIGGPIANAWRGFARNVAMDYANLTNSTEHAKRVTADFSLAMMELAKMTEGLSGAQLQAVLSSEDYEVALTRVAATGNHVRDAEWDLGMAVFQRGAFTRDANEFDQESIRQLEVRARSAFLNAEGNRENAASLERYNAMAEYFLLSTGGNEEALAGLRGETELTTEQMDMLTDAIDETRKAQLALVDPVYAAIRAERDLREANAELIDSEERLLALPNEQASARSRLATAQRDQAVAAQSLAAAEAEVQRLEDAGLKSTDEYREARDRMADARVVDRDATRELASAQERLNSLNSEAAEIDDRLVDAVLDLMTAEIERNAALDAAELVNSGFVDSLAAQVDALGLSASATDTLVERLNDLGIEVDRYDVDPFQRAMRDMILSQDDLQAAFDDSGMSADDFKRDVLHRLFTEGEITRQKYQDLWNEVDTFGASLDAIDGRQTSSTHVHTQVTKFIETFDPLAYDWAAEKRASGGPVQAGRPYLVGEQGPELMVPGVSGTILNAAQMAASGLSGGGGITIQNYTTVRPIDDDILLSKLEWAQERGRL